MGAALASCKLSSGAASTKLLGQEELAVTSSTTSPSPKAQSRTPENIQTGAQRGSSAFRPNGLLRRQEQRCRTCPSAEQAELNVTGQQSVKWMQGKRTPRDHRMVGVGRDLCGSSSPTLLLKQGHLQ